MVSLVNAFRLESKICLTPQLQMSFPLEAFATEGGDLVAPAIKDWVAKVHARYVTSIRVVIPN